MKEQVVAARPANGEKCCLDMGRVGTGVRVPNKYYTVDSWIHRIRGLSILGAPKTRGDLPLLAPPEIVFWMQHLIANNVTAHLLIAMLSNTCLAYEMRVGL